MLMGHPYRPSQGAVSMVRIHLSPPLCFTGFKLCTGVLHTSACLLGITLKKDLFRMVHLRVWPSPVQGKGQELFFFYQKPNTIYRKENYLLQHGSPNSSGYCDVSNLLATVIIAGTGFADAAVPSWLAATKANATVLFGMATAGEPLGCLSFPLFADEVPKIAGKPPCSEPRRERVWVRGPSFHRIIPAFMCPVVTSQVVTVPAAGPTMGRDLRARALS